jgi:hypothetical protein
VKKVLQYALYSPVVIPGLGTVCDPGKANEEVLLERFKNFLPF